MAARKKRRFEQEISWLLNDKYGGVSLVETSGQLRAAIEKDTARIKVGEPVDYVIGFARFLGCRIDLSKKPLIPRTETEYWVGKAVEEIEVKLQLKKPHSSIKCLDIFAGSGCVGVALLKHLAYARVDFAEIDRRLIGQIKINCKLNNIEPDRYCAIQSDIFSKITGTYDYIFANPPYCSEKNAGRVQGAVLKYEPKSAVFGGSDGLRYIRPFLAQAKSFLKPGGKIYCECDPSQRRIIERLARGEQYTNCEFFKDQFGRWRYFVIQYC